MFASAGQLALEARLADLVAERAVLADQVANLDTPGYDPNQAAAFAPVLAAQVAAELGLGAGGAASGAGAPGGPGSALAAWPVPVVPAPGPVTPDGNAVGLDATMVALAQDDLAYQAVARQLALVYQGLQTAIDLGGA